MNWRKLLVPSAYVLVNTKIGSERDVLKEIRNIPNIEETYITYGVYDIIVKVVADSIDKIEDTISLKLRHLDKIESTLSFLVIEKKIEEMFAQTSICV